jgi:hypothetical protein
MPSRANYRNIPDVIIGIASVPTGTAPLGIMPKVNLDNAIVSPNEFPMKISEIARARDFI